MLMVVWKRPRGVPPKSGTMACQAYLRYAGIFTYNTRRSVGNWGRMEETASTKGMVEEPAERFTSSLLFSRQVQFQKAFGKDSI